MVSWTESNRSINQSIDQWFGLLLWPCVAGLLFWFTPGNVDENEGKPLSCWPDPCLQDVCHVIARREAGMFWCLPPPGLESRGCHLISSFYLLSCCSAYSCCSFCLLLFLLFGPVSCQLSGHFLNIFYFRDSLFLYCPSFVFKLFL